MRLAESAYCTGCGACAKICPKQAIKWVNNEEGFPTPHIIESNCVECGMCEKICPALHMPETQEIKNAFAVQIKDSEALKESTSGGVFTVLSREIFKNGGVVYGCVWDENYNAFITRAETEAEIAAMRGSKYVWSWAGDTFPEIKGFLEKGKTVMFTGLPCQTAGLKKYLKKDYDNLFLVDFLCSGAPSPMALSKYLDTICDVGERKTLNLKFRDKLPYGVGVHITYNGQTRKTRPAGEHISNPYYYSFYIRMIDRESCYHCKYNTRQRVSDLTLGDYWGVADYHRNMSIRDGVSALLVNTEKGNLLFSAVRDKLNVEQTQVEWVAKENNLSVTDQSKIVRKPVNREAFFSVLNKEGWRAAEKKYLNNPMRFKQWIKVKIPKKILNMLLQIKKSLKGDSYA